MILQCVILSWDISLVDYKMVSGDEMEIESETRGKTPSEYGSEDESDEESKNANLYKNGKFEPVNLNLAIRNDDKEYVRTYIKEGGRVTPAREHDLSPLTVAIMTNRDSAIAIMLLEAGAPLQPNDIREEEGIQTPLGMAVSLGQTTMVKKILEYDRHNAVMNHRSVEIDINLREGEDDLTPLLRAVLIHSSKSDIARILMKRGANPLDIDEYGITALSMAASWVKLTMVRYMLKIIRIQRKEDESDDEDEIDDDDEDEKNMKRKINIKKEKYHRRILVPVNVNGYGICRQVKLMLKLVHKSRQPKLETILDLLDRKTEDDLYRGY